MWVRVPPSAPDLRARSPTGRGGGLKNRKVWVRLPPGPPRRGDREARCPVATRRPPATAGAGVRLPPSPPARQHLRTVSPRNERSIGGARSSSRGCLPRLAVFVDTSELLATLGGDDLSIDQKADREEPVPADTQLRPSTDRAWREARRRPFLSSSGGSRPPSKSGALSERSPWEPIRAPAKP